MLVAGEGGGAMGVLLSLLMLVVGAAVGYLLHDRVQCEIKTCEVTLTVETEQEPEFLMQANAHMATLLIQSDGEHPAGWCSLPSDVAPAEARFYLEANDVQIVEALLQPAEGEEALFPVTVTCENVVENSYVVGEEGDI
jgi:hypothetical protein